MSKKISITPIARELLWVLEEAGEEELLVAVNSTYKTMGARETNFLSHMSKELVILSELGLIELTERSDGGTASHFRINLNNLLKIDTVANRFVYQAAESDIMIELTFKGAEFLTT